MTVLFGSARLLAEQDPGLLSHVDFLATPTEEYVDLSGGKAYEGKERCAL